MTCSEIKDMMKRRDIDALEARRILLRRELRIKIEDAESIEDLKDVVLSLVNEM